MNRMHEHKRAVVCLHSSASSGRQWASLAQHLGDGYRVIAPDLQGYGSNPPWNRGKSLSLREEAALLESLLLEQDEPVHLVGHSYGASTAMRLALDHPQRVLSLALYEPTLFSLLLTDPARPNGIEEILAVANEVIHRLEAEDPERAARCFVSYWGGSGAWERLTDDQRRRLARRAHKAPADFHALFHAGIDRAAVRELQVPLLCLYGMETRVPARQIARCLGATVPKIELLRLPNMGHMGPMTHPVIVDALIGEFLNRQDRKSASVFGVQSGEAHPRHGAVPGLSRVPQPA